MIRPVQFVRGGLLVLLLTACAPVAAPAATSESAAPAVVESVDESVDLSGIKTYLVDQASALAGDTAALADAANRYYSLAEAAGFDYAALWASDADAVVAALEDVRTAWLAASPAYEKMEGIVAGTPSLADYDVILDAGASGADDPENAAPFDLTLDDGRVLPKPGNLFGVTESTLWGTDPTYVVADVAADWDGDGTVTFGETLPDAYVLKAGATTLDEYAQELQTSVEAWTPTPSDAFTALVVMVPTMSEYFASWRDSRFVAGDASTQRDFVVISRLADIQDILGGLELVYAEVRPMVETVDADQAAQIATDLTNLRAFVADIYAEEQGGRRFAAEDVDLLGAEAQNRATAITGQISQVAAELGITIEG